NLIVVERRTSWRNGTPSLPWFSRLLERRQLRLWRQSAALVAVRSVITDRKTRVALRSSAGLFSIVGFPVARSLIVVVWAVTPHMRPVSPLRRFAANCF